jgi:hypothetical protein
VDAIKIYEYLAMGLPVVTAGVRPPLGAEAFVRQVEGTDAFLAGVESAALAGPGQRASARAFAASHTWSSRVDQLLAWLSAGVQHVAEKRALFQDLP